MELIGEESVDIVVAEVFDDHISRILVRLAFTSFITFLSEVEIYATFELLNSKSFIYPQDDGTHLRYVNDYNRTIYAFEMLPPPLVEDISGNISDDTSTLTSDATSHGSTGKLHYASLFNHIYNKKVLLRERKRHTARRIPSARYAALSSGGGYPGYPPLHHPDLAQGVPPTIQTWPGEVPWVTPTIQTWLGYPPPQTWDGVPPTPDLG